MASDEQKQKLREEIMKESFDLAKRSRLGMFSVPISTAIGDDNYFKPKQARKGPDGQVITEPRNFTTKNAKKGHIDSVLFSKPDYITVGDPYQDSSKFKLRDTKDNFKQKGGEQFETNFKPAKTFQRKVKADFEHMSDYKELSKVRKAPDGSVITEPKNFLTNPPKRGIVGKQTNFGGNPEYMPDPFERRKEI